MDILLNNAGVALLEPVLDVTVEKWDAQIDVNLKAPFFLAQVVARHMVESGRGGKIINVALTAGLVGDGWWRCRCRIRRRGADHR